MKQHLGSGYLCVLRYEKQAASPVRTYLICPLFNNANFTVTLAPATLSSLSGLRMESCTTQLSGLPTAWSLLSAALIHNLFQALVTLLNQVLLEHRSTSLAMLLLLVADRKVTAQNCVVCWGLLTPQLASKFYKHYLLHQNIVMELPWRTVPSMTHNTVRQSVVSEFNTHYTENTALC